MFDFKDKLVVITGAAGNLGSSVAQEFLSYGANLVLVDHAQDKLGILFPELVNAKDHIIAEGIDLTKKEPIEGLVSEVSLLLGPIYALVNIAGGYRAGNPVHETPLETWDFLIDLNAGTVFNTCQAVIPNMIKEGSGKIVNIAARQGLRAGKNMGAYSASKSAVIRLTESMSAELKNHNINVNCICPGYVLSGWELDSYRIEFGKIEADKRCLKRDEYPEDLIGTAIFLASSDSDFVTGQTIVVDGGEVML